MEDLIPGGRKNDRSIYRIVTSIDKYLQRAGLVVRHQGVQESVSISRMLLMRGEGAPPESGRTGLAGAEAPDDAAERVCPADDLLLVELVSSPAGDREMCTMAFDQAAQRLPRFRRDLRDALPLLYRSVPSIVRARVISACRAG